MAFHYREIPSGIPRVFWRAYCRRGKDIMFRRSDILTVFMKWPLRKWVDRSTLTTGPFPVIYFIPGMIEAPLLTEYYRHRIPGLAIPPPGIIIFIQIIRSTVFFLLILPVIIHRGGSRMQCILSLGLAHFILVFSYDIMLTCQMPYLLILIQGIEVFLDSILCTLIFIILLYPDHIMNSTVRKNN